MPTTLPSVALASEPSALPATPVPISVLTASVAVFITRMR